MCGAPSRKSHATVRIDLPAATPADALQAVGDAVHQALAQTFNVPHDDRFQVLARRAPGELVCTPEYMGVRHGANVVFVQITCSPGRSLEMKRALYARIATDVAARGGFKAADVIINLVETLRENWSFGNGIAHYAPAS
ncbi:MAG: tautomerase family protein [Comamonadaceae bacterium]|nr:MAG: tautomerase family protein [Comamonadaceae bacterium]